jgi:hypothetical protein
MVPLRRELLGRRTFFDYGRETRSRCGVFLLPGLFIGLLGGWVGCIYLKAQLSVKREMSNAKAPVLGHFGAAIAGLSKWLPGFYDMRAHSLNSVDPRVWCRGGI